MTDEKTSAGCCVCGEIQYQMTSSPLVVHCCHCSWCQRETGAAFVRVGTLESPGPWPHDVHIFASTKHPWLNLNDEVPVLPE